MNDQNFKEALEEGKHVIELGTYGETMIKHLQALCRHASHRSFPERLFFSRKDVLSYSDKAIAKGRAALSVMQ
jgi:hypothetical protein